MSYNKTVTDFQFRWILVQGLINPWNMIFTSDTSVNIMFHGLINPCIHLMESHQLYIIPFLTRRRWKVGIFIDIPASALLHKTLVPRSLNALHVSDVNKVFSFRYHPLHVSELNDLYFYSTSCLMCFSLEYIIFTLLSFFSFCVFWTINEINSFGVISFWLKWDTSLVSFYWEIWLDKTHYGSHTSYFLSWIYFMIYMMNTVMTLFGQSEC